MRECVSPLSRLLFPAINVLRTWDLAVSLEMALQIPLLNLFLKNAQSPEKDRTSHISFAPQISAPKANMRRVDHREVQTFNNTTS
jgi:hypothetical protein